MKIGYRQLVAEADSQIVAIGVEEANALVDDPDTVIVDVRDARRARGLDRRHALRPAEVETAVTQTRRDGDQAIVGEQCI